jgi:uncharacterized protein (TIGR00730 family)
LNYDQIKKQVRNSATQNGASFLYVIFGSSTINIADSVHLSPMIDSSIKHMAKSGCGIVNGGYLGTMSYTARLVRENGGVAIGIMCGNLNDNTEPQHFDELVAAKDHWERLRALVEIADAFVVLPGGIGTAAELSTTIWCADRSFSSRRPTLFIGDNWQDWLSATTTYSHALRGSEINDYITIAKTTEDVDIFFNSLITTTSAKAS